MAMKPNQNSKLNKTSCEKVGIKRRKTELLSGVLKILITTIAVPINRAGAHKSETSVTIRLIARK